MDAYREKNGILLTVAQVEHAVKNTDLIILSLIQLWKIYKCAHFSCAASRL